MKREVMSKQRLMRTLNFICSADGTTVSGPDKNQVVLTDTGTGVKTITLNQAFASSSQYVVQVTCATAASIAQVAITSASVFVVNSFAVDGTTAKDAITHITVIGADTTSQY